MLSRDAEAGHQARRGSHRARPRRRRPRVRRELRRARGCPGAGGLRRARADRRPLRDRRAPDARVRGGPPEPIQPPEAFLSRGLEVHPDGNGADLELWLDPRYIRAGYSWSFPADEELRVGVGSFDPRDKVKEPTLDLARDVDVPAV